MSIISPTVSSHQDQPSSIVGDGAGFRYRINYGVCLWWSDRSPWIHPQDLTVANQFVPGTRVFRREECENVSDRELGYSVLCYGDIRIRVLPAIWLNIGSEGFELFDFVEIKSQHGKLRPGLAEIREIMWNRNSRRIEYYLSRNGKPIGRPFLSSDIQPAIRLGSHLGTRELELSKRLSA